MRPGYIFYFGRLKGDFVKICDFNLVIILVIFSEFLEFSLNMPCRPPQRATRMIRSDNRNQTGESGCKTVMEWFNKNHEKSLKYRLLNTDNKVFTNISDLITYKFTCDNCHVGHVTSYCIVLSRKFFHFGHILELQKVSIPKYTYIWE